ncbi:MAG: lysophospholipid acyltransferase family protein [Bacteroidota bacterium]
MKRIVLFLKTWSEYIGFLGVRLVARGLSFRVAGAIGQFLGGAVYRFTAIRKRVTMENLEKAFPEKTGSELQLIALGAFRNYGRAIFEMFWSWGAAPERFERIIHPVNPEVARAARQRGRGLIFLSAHFGSWELLLPGFLVSLGWSISAIVQRQRNKKIDAIVDRNRSRFEVRTVAMGQSVREVLKCLKEKNVLLLLGDQSGSKESVYIPFFGRPAATHRGAAAFALKTGAPLVMALLIRREDGGYDFQFEEVVYADLREYTEENIVELTRRHAAVLERYVRRYPDHWLWMHKRWKHTPYYEEKLKERRQEADGTPA